MISTSTDGGQTWTTSQSMPPHLVYQDNPTPVVSGMGEIYHQASTDGGKTWSEAKKITDDPDADLRGQYFPNVSVAPNGRVDAVWWDTRDDPGMYTAAFQFEVVGPANNDSARIVLAAVVGLIVVGLVLLGVAVAAKRRNGPPPAPVSGPQAKPAKVG